MKAFEKNIRKVEPYVPGEQPQRKVIKLNTNENPYPPAPGVTKALEEMDTDRFRLYPDPTAAPLVNVLADFYHVNPDQVFVGVGSDDVLSMCFLTFFNSEKPIFFPEAAPFLPEAALSLFVGFKFSCHKFLSILPRL